jgi:hypothetical protein
MNTVFEFIENQGGVKRTEDNSHARAGYHCEIEFRAWVKVNEQSVAFGQTVTRKQISPPARYSLQVEIGETFGLTGPLQNQSLEVSFIHCLAVYGLEGYVRKIGIFPHEFGFHCRPGE